MDRPIAAAFKQYAERGPARLPDGRLAAGQPKWVQVGHSLEYGTLSQEMKPRRTRGCASGWKTAA